MPKALVLIWGFIFAIFTSAYGQENFTVSGEISFHEEKGQILVWLKTQEEFEKRIEPRIPSRSLTVKPNPQQLKAKKVAFKFVDIPKGIYGIYCIQDFNKNGKLDHSAETVMPIEPYGYSGPAYFGPAQWEDIKFNVEKDVSGIEIKF